MVNYLWTIFFLTLISFFASGQSTTAPCTCCTEKHRQFDFWLGEWEVRNNGNLAGKNTIILMQDSCLIREEWTSSQSAYTGTSYNFYNQDKDQWQQLWIDNQGGYLELTGSFQDGKMILESEEMTNQKGERYFNRITWTPNPDGTVRQHWEITKDNGLNWNTVFDGIYSKADK